MPCAKKKKIGMNAIPTKLTGKAQCHSEADLHIDHFHHSIWRLVGACFRTVQIVIESSVRALGSSMGGRFDRGPAAAGRPDVELSATDVLQPPVAVDSASSSSESSESSIQFVSFVQKKHVRQP